MVRQELGRATRSKLSCHLSQGCGAEQLSGAQRWDTTIVCLNDTMDRRHETVPVVVSVKQYSLAQL
jgi:hypothetical protein